MRIEAIIGGHAGACCFFAGRLEARTTPDGDCGMKRLLGRHAGASCFVLQQARTPAPHQMAIALWRLGVGETVCASIPPGGVTRPTVGRFAAGVLTRLPVCTNWEGAIRIEVKLTCASHSAHAPPNVDATSITSTPSTTTPTLYIGTVVHIPQLKKLKKPKKSKKPKESKKPMPIYRPPTCPIPAAKFMLLSLPPKRRHRWARGRSLD